METDEEFYRLGTEFPDALVGLVRGARPEGGYSMRSLTVKDVERAGCQARVENIRRLLESRFGQLPAPVEKRLEALESVEQLRALFDAALEARSLEEFARQL